MVTLNIPPVPPGLRALSPYLQRAEELKVKDPVIAYWCKHPSPCISRLIANLEHLPGVYYAAQQGIALHDPTVRAFLFGLLDLLERVKAEIGKNDAITDDAASAAYVENFAIRVFAAADNEDRRGNATRCVSLSLEWIV